MARGKNKITVDFSRCLDERIRDVHIVHDWMGYSLREMLRAKPRDRHKWMTRMKQEFRALGDKLIALDKEIER